jgi:hypothetical protein
MRAQIALDNDQEIERKKQLLRFLKKRNTKQRADEMKELFD